MPTTLTRTARGSPLQSAAQRSAKTAARHPVRSAAKPRTLVAALKLEQAVVRRQIVIESEPQAALGCQCADVVDVANAGFRIALAQLRIEALVARRGVTAVITKR